MKKYLLILLTTLFISFLYSQNSQTIRGKVVDMESKQALIGCSVVIPDTEPLKGTTTDIDGNFKIEDVPVGRVNLLVSYLGYETLTVNQITLSSGKELVLDLEMKESFQSIDEVTITSTTYNNEPLNEMSTLSARSFSVEETKRYAASVSDPARMASVFGGVTIAGDDIFNEISVRGNSPRGVHWRLEGIEIPNPNHFGSLGSGGGAISMLSSSTLSRSDFYTGAFPAEYGNASSGVFDLRLRSGNNEVREHSFMFGLLGIEASTEGYFKKGSRSSYLINYRYSTLSLLSLIYNPIGDIVPAYQDMSFKINLPSKSAGTFSIFGLGGMNSNTFDAEQDSTHIEFNSSENSFTEKQKVGILGFSHKISLNDKMYMKTVVMGSVNSYEDEYYFLNSEKNYARELFDYTTFNDYTSRVSTMLNYKSDSRNVFRFGSIYSYNKYKFNYDNMDKESGEWTNYLDSRGNSSMIQSYAQWKHRLTEEVTTNAGIHYTHLFLNNTFSIEPRAAVEWKYKEGQSLSLAAGIHSKPDHISTYLIEETDQNGAKSLPNKDLEIPKSIQLVMGYKNQLSRNLRISIEPYFQYHYDIAIEKDPSSNFSMLNTAGIWEVIGTDSLESKGSGRNYGIDLVVERSFAQNYYFLSSASLYRSEFKAHAKEYYSTRYDGNYIWNLLGGKEIVLKNESKRIGLNGKFVLSGGFRQSEIDLERSIDAGEEVLTGKPFQDRTGVYYRLDLGFSYSINRKRSTHSFMLDVQNVFNKANVYAKFYDNDSRSIEYYEQTGLFPFFNYRLEFQ